MSGTDDVLEATEHGAVAVGVDGSERSLAALQWALDEARRRNARTKVVYVYRHPALHDPHGPDRRSPPLSLAAPTWGTFDLAAVEAASRQHAEGVVQDALDALGRGSHDSTIERITVPGDAAATLVDLSEDVDLLVLGSRGHGGLSGRRLGSVTSKCVHHARCPVVVVRETSPASRAARSDHAELLPFT